MTGRFARFALILGLLAAPSFAQIDVAAWATWMEPQGDRLSSDPADPTAISEIAWDAETGFGFSANFHMGRALSVELAAYAVGADAALVAPGGPQFDLGALDLTPVTATLQWHFARGARIDPYVGVGGAWILAEDLSSADLDALGIGDVEVDDEFTWLINAGLDFSVTSSLGIVLDGKYFPFEPATRAAGDPIDTDLAVDPLLLSVGLRWRF
ncbi:MAG TPA: OmpW family outer membrane protein [Thermoanaerobaculia bacterium]|nr:OmpW family outer membrane protein [Thermoanaerobaculia bacterium]